MIIIVFISCKKDKLNGEYSNLIGKWRWIATYNSSGVNTMNAQSFDDKVIEFKQKGVYKVWFNTRFSSRGTVEMKTDYLIFHKSITDKNRTDALSLKHLDTQNIRNDTLYLYDYEPCYTCLIDVFVRK